MSIALALVVGGVTLVAAVVVLLRLRALHREIQDLHALEQRNGDLIQKLTGRVYLLEQNRGPAEVVLDQPAEPVLRRAAPVNLPAVTNETVAEPQSRPAVESQPAKKPREDWEVVIGGNWLNKLGVLAIVVGIALFLAYSLTQLGPAGKVAIGFVVGLSMLGTGIAIEGRPRYGTFSQGFIGGGWAAIYFTAYAMHGIEAARIVADPFTGTSILLAVSIGMILYSFRYQSQAVTSVAYLIAFVTLNVTALTGFSVVAALLLAISVVVIAWHFQWFGLATVGIALTYVTFAARYEPAIYGRTGVLNGQVILSIYWALFECFDLLGIEQKREEHRPGALYALNAAGFFIASWVHGVAMNRQYWAGLLMASAVAYVATSVIRWRLLENRDSAFTAFRGRYFGPAFIAASCAAGALIERYFGLRLGVALLVEAELIVTAGVLLKRLYPVHLGTLFCLLPIVHLLAVDIGNGAKVTIAGHEWMQWSLFALAIVVALYANRLFAGGLWLNSIVASILLSAVIHQEVQRSWATVVWAAFACGLVAYGILEDRNEFRLQGYLLAVVVFFRAWDVNMNEPVSGTRIVTSSLVVAAFYAMQLLHRGRQAPNQIEAFAAPGLSIFGTAILSLLLASEVQGRLLTVAFGIEGVALLMVGFVLRERVFRVSGLLLFLFCIAKLFIYDLQTLDTMSRILSFIVLGLLMVGASWVYTRFRDQIHKLL